MSSFEGMEIPRITVRQVATRLAGGQEVIFLDARSEEDWQRAALQIPGSLRAPPDRLERLPAMPDDPVVVAYCT